MELKVKVNGQMVIGKKGPMLNRAILLGLVLALLLGTSAIASNRVLVVHSYHEQFTWTSEIDKTIRAEFEGEDIDLNVFFMDTKRNSSEPTKQRAGRKAIDLVRKFRPKVVIAVDDNAQTYFAKSFVDKSPVQFVFCGVNAGPETHGYPASNVTGILERTYPAQSLKVLKTLMPGIQGVAVVIDDSATSEIMRPRIKKRISTLAPEISLVRYAVPKTFNAWKKEILSLERNPKVHALLIPLYHTVRDDGGMTSLSPSEVMRWTLAHVNKPVVGIGTHVIEDGGLLAVTVDPREHGRVAAQMAKAILAGKRADDIPMRTNKDGYVMVNLRGNERFVFDAKVQVEQIADLVIR